MSAKKLSELPQQTTLAGTDTVMGIDASASEAFQNVTFPLATLASWVLDQLPAANVRAAYETERTLMTQSAAEAGSETTVRLLNALRLRQAIDARIGSLVVNTTTDTAITGLLKGAAGKVAQAVAGTDYLAGIPSPLALAPDPNESALTVSSYSLTGTDATPMLDLSGTWNTSGAPTALKLNITDTNSDAASKLFDFQIGGVSKHSLTRVGEWTNSGPFYGNAIKHTNTGGGNTLAFYNSDNNIQCWLTGNNYWNTSVLDWFTSSFQLGHVGASLLLLGHVQLRCPVAAVLQLGENQDAGTPIAQTITAHDVTTGTGASLTLAGGTGSSGKGNVTLDGGSRHLPSTFDIVDVFKTLYDHGLLSPPLNTFLSSSEDVDSITINLQESNGTSSVHSVETRFSTDNATWSTGPPATDTGSNGSIELSFTGLAGSTQYYLQWRSVAPNNSAVHSEWGEANVSTD